MRCFSLSALLLLVSLVATSGSTPDNRNNRKLNHHGNKHHQHHEEKKHEQQMQLLEARDSRQSLSTDMLAALMNATSIYSLLTPNGTTQGAFSTLSTGINAAGLVETLTNAGTYTLFAPTNAAIEKLDAKLLDPVWQPQLEDLLLYHTLGSTVNSADLVDGMIATTLNGENITINLEPARVNEDSLLLEDAVDIEASNGVIHGIDTVLAPTSLTSNIAQIAIANEDLSSFIKFVRTARFASTLFGDGPYTVFAPTNEAFAALPEETLKELLLPENKDKLTDILMYHVVAANAPSSSLESSDIDTLNGDSVAIDVSDMGVMVNGANVIKADVIASNGIIHIIDKVLIPSRDDDVDVVSDTDDTDIGLDPDDLSMPPILITGPVEGLPTSEDGQSVDPPETVEDSGIGMHTSKASKTKSSKAETLIAKSSKAVHSLKSKSFKGKGHKNHAAKVHKAPDGIPPKSPSNPSTTESKGEFSMPKTPKAEALKAKSSKAVHGLKSKSFKGKVHKDHAAKAAKVGYSMPNSTAAKSSKKEHVAPEAKAHKMPANDAKAQKVSSNEMVYKSKQSKRIQHGGASLSYETAPP